MVSTGPRAFSLSSLRQSTDFCDDFGQRLVAMTLEQKKDSLLPCPLPTVQPQIRLSDRSSTPERTILSAISTRIISSSRDSYHRKPPVAFPRFSLTLCISRSVLGPSLNATLAKSPLWRKSPGSRPIINGHIDIKLCSTRPYGLHVHPQTRMLHSSTFKLGKIPSHGLIKDVATDTVSLLCPCTTFQSLAPLTPCLRDTREQHIENLNALDQLGAGQELVT